MIVLCVSLIVVCRILFYTVKRIFTLDLTRSLILTQKPSYVDRSSYSSSSIPRRVLELKHRERSASGRARRVFRSLGLG